MPDGLGRFNLKEMRERVWRWTNQLTPETVSDGGVESGTPRVTPLYTATDVDIAINRAITGRYLDLAINAEELLQDEELINVQTGITEYPIPTDCCFLRSLWWKDPFVVSTLVPPSERMFMHQVDEGINRSINAAPTYRRSLDLIVLNEPPVMDNVEGIQVRYVKWALYLRDDDEILETQMARLMQEIIIMDAAAALADTRGGLVYNMLNAEIQKWETRMTATVREALMPPFVNIVSEYQRQLANRR